MIGLLPMQFYRTERYSLTACLGMFLATWILLAGSWAFGFAAGTMITFGCGLIATVARRKLPKREDNTFATTPQAGLWLVVTVPFSILVTYLLYTHMLGPGPEGYYSASGSWGDLPLHLSIMTNVAYERAFHADFSLFAGAKLTYPFLIDFLSGMLLKWTDNLRLSLLVTSIPLCLSLIQIMFFAFVRLLGSFRAAAIALTLFLLSGSSFGFVSLIGDFIRQRPLHISFLWHLPVDYSNTFIYGFGNFFNSILLPQRGFQFGLPIFCLIVILSAEALRKKGRDVWKLVLFAAILTGLLPLAHTHTFFVAAGMFLLVATYLTWRGRLSVGCASLAAAICISLALPQLLFQLTANGQVHFLRYHPAWMFSSGTLPDIKDRPLAAAVYLFDNFGLLFGLALLGYRSLNPLLKTATLLGATIFVLGNVFVFQPAEYDNIKFFIYGSLLLLPSAALWLARLSRSNRLLPKLAAGSLCLLYVASGAAAVIYELPQRHLLYAYADVAEAKALRQALPINKLVLTSDYHQHPLWGLAGQPVLRGYAYWLWSYGLPVAKFEEEVPRMYAGDQPALDLLSRYEIDFVYIGPSERAMYKANEAFYARLFPAVFHQDGVTVYRIR